jgi:cytochrome c-type biogenesis protein
MLRADRARFLKAAPPIAWTALRRYWFAAALVLVIVAVGVLIWISISKVRSEGGYAALLSQNLRTEQQIAKLLTREATGPYDEDVTVLYATSEYFRSAKLFDEAAEHAPDVNALFVIAEEVHEGDLPPALVPVLRIDARFEYLPAERKLLTDSPHHRATLYTYSRPDGAPLVDATVTSVELVIEPEASATALSTARWDLPIDYEVTAPRRGFSWAMILAIMGGLLASMWPCLFQLTAFFIPSMAGVSMEQAHRREGFVAPIGIVKTAIFFVLGFVIVYTAAGALAGLAAQSLSGSAVFQAARQPLGIGAGVIIILLALRVAARARVPLVCKMPVIGWGTKSGKPQGYLATMITGFAFATGCMTCFGAALALGMLTYVGTSGSVVTGAFVLFLFSLGMGIPLVAGAALMARALPLLGKLEKIAPWMAVLSSLIMLGFAILMITDNYHVVSDLFLRWAGLA